MTEPRDPRPATRLLQGRYRIEEPLGSGGMAVVYRGHDQLLDRPVAIKLLATEPEQDRAAAFLAEARAAAPLLHPNIVTVYDVGVDQARPFIVMEYLEGTSLQEELGRRGILPLDEIVAIGLQLASALAYAHSQGVLHCDVKPQNILIGPAAGGTRGLRWQVKLADFGIARALDRPAADDGPPLGTVEYASPEQILNQPLGPASDLYSLGVLLYQLAAGRLPFTAPTGQELARKHVHEEPPPPDLVSPRVPPGLSSLILRLLAKQPSRRLSSATELEALLFAQQQSSASLTGPLAMPDLTAPPPLWPAAGRPREPAVWTAPERRFDWLGLFLGVATVAWLLLGLVFVLNILARREAVPPVPAGRAVPAGPATLALLPELIGRSRAEAEALLGPLGIALDVSGEEESTTVGPGRIVHQEPGAGTEVGPGSRVAVRVSAGQPAPIVVPQLQGRAASEAEALLQQSGLSAARQEEASPSPPGVVIGQVPAAGEFLQRGATVALLVSRGPPLVQVPDVAGLPEREALRLIEAHGLRNFPFVNYQGHSVLPDTLLRQVCVGCVLSTQPRYPSLVPPGTEIKMAVRED
ncbi:MAG: protein kinase [Chloroflexi bacterium]|nr:protein kinase [Chloroflexota bacterium]